MGLTQNTAGTKERQERKWLWMFDGWLCLNLIVQDYIPFNVLVNGGTSLSI